MFKFLIIHFIRYDLSFPKKANKFLKKYASMKIIINLLNQ